MAGKPNEKKPTITFDELAQSAAVPEIPKHFKDQLWRTVRVSREIKVTEETEHFLNMMCLHFGLSRSEVIAHSINLLWKELIQSITTERLKLYEEKLEMMRLYRLQQKEAKAVRKSERIKESMEEWRKKNPDAPERAYGKCITWSYRHDKPVSAKPNWRFKKLYKI